MAVLAFLILLYFLLYVFVPKGFALYDGLRFPGWTYRMRTFPHRDKRVPDRYVYGGHNRQYLIHYRPRSERDTRDQVVVYVHGGGWQFGNPEMFRPNAQLLDSMGFHSFFISHRRLPLYNIRHIREDMVAGMRQVREVMERMGISQKKIILGGVSSGANLCALFYLDKKMWEEAGYENGTIAGLMLLAPPLNLDGMWQSPTLWWLAGRRDGERFEQANPIRYLNEKTDLPILLVHPEKDGMVPLKSTLVFVEKARELGFPNLEFHVLPGMTHLDAASWCFKDHACHPIVAEWLQRF